MAKTCKYPCGGVIKSHRAYACGAVSHPHSRTVAVVRSRFARFEKDHSVLTAAYQLHTKGLAAAFLDNAAHVLIARNRLARNADDNIALVNACFSCRRYDTVTSVKARKLHYQNSLGHKLYAKWRSAGNYHRLCHLGDIYILYGKYAEKGQLLSAGSQRPRHCRCILRALQIKGIIFGNNTL